MSQSEKDFVIPDDFVADGRMAELGDACEGFLLDEAGKFDAARLDVRRKSLCQYLGVGESTFTGWVQAGRIPRAAAIASFKRPTPNSSPVLFRASMMPSV